MVWSYRFRGCGLGYRGFSEFAVRFWISYIGRAALCRGRKGAEFRKTYHRNSTCRGLLALKQILRYSNPPGGRDIDREGESRSSKKLGGRV